LRGDGALPLARSDQRLTRAEQQPGADRPERGRSNADAGRVDAERPPSAADLPQVPGDLAGTGRQGRAAVAPERRPGTGERTGDRLPGLVQGELGQTPLARAPRLLPAAALEQFA